MLGRGAARPVDTHQVVGVDLQAFAGPQIPCGDVHEIRVLVETFKLALEPNLHAGQRLCVLAQNLFNAVLGDPLRVFRILRVPTRSAVKAFSKRVSPGPESPVQKTTLEG